VSAASQKLTIVTLYIKKKLALDQLEVM